MRRAVRRRGLGLRARITLLATGLVAAVSGILLWLGWLLVGEVLAEVPQFPSGTLIRVDGVDVEATRLATILRDNARAQVLEVGAVAFLCVVLAVLTLAWSITGRVLSPLHRVTATARRLSAESLGERIDFEGARDEVAELADTFDEMLARLEAAFDSQRRFVANASHELRTPLAVIRTELDVTLADGDADIAELRRMAGVVQDATRRAAQLVEALLLLAKTDAVGLAVREPVDLAVVVESAWRAARAEAESRGLRVAMHTEPVLVMGDPALLERVAGNLLENAVRHNVEQGWIEVHADSDAENARLTVAASGPIVSPERVTELLEPFSRGGTGRTAQSGAGLGLSIVRAAVGAHGGRVTVDAIPGGGMAVGVSLPVAP
ncbi:MULTISPECIES: sensor histidine kinase [Actinoalloteichus]|uniref:histidine kinase n=1 Tax=Actinoalloteichus fjordicus TaxID=1612552 RepID=A0AAC9LCG1_9PSEU|nr:MULTISPECIES: ATP-binding protein [Actinoalloteichus]APU13769.1 signal transduction histidine kinase [Actinoalloteichus fjordicus]APU19714.1 signal transduction histidine kinase [Actinoalloteichus sp. GBA129-24]